MLVGRCVVERECPDAVIDICVDHDCGAVSGRGQLIQMLLGMTEGRHRSMTKGYVLRAVEGEIFGRLYSHCGVPNLKFIIERVGSWVSCTLHRVRLT